MKCGLDKILARRGNETSAAVWHLSVAQHATFALLVSLTHFVRERCAPEPSANFDFRICASRE
jgi:hypothetical protein